MLAAAPSCHAAWSLPRARRWQDRARARADGRAPLGRARVDAPVRGVQARPWRLRVRSSSPPTRAPGRERPTGCLDRRTVAALGAARFVACPLDAETPLLERGLASCF